MKRSKSRQRPNDVQILNPALADVLARDEAARQARPRAKTARPRYQRDVVARTDAQLDFYAGMELNDICFGYGPAGTGKTYMAVSKACEMLEKGEVDRIIFSRPAVTAAGEELGHLPGDIREKLDPYMRPLYDIVASRIGHGEVKRLVETGVIELCPLGFMRGRTFSNAAIVLDEMQNATAPQFKMALTRIGENAKIFVTGDPDQVDDLPGGAESGLLPTIAALRDAPGIDIVKFDKSGCVRSRPCLAVLERL